MNAFSLYIRRILFIIGLGSLIIVSPIFSGCDKSDDCDDPVLGQLVDFTEYSGCGWLIQLTDGSMLEPINLGAYDVELKDGAVIEFEYHKTSGMMSICMIGSMVEIDCVTEW